MRTRFAPISVAALLVVLGAAASDARQTAPAPVTGQICSLNWVGHETDFETFLTSGKVLKMEDVPIGVTKPQRGYLEPGPIPAARFAWKALPPGQRRGFRESYKAEIAAYHLDRLLEMHMVPPVVERTLDGKVGAAVYWVESVKGWDMKKPVQGPEPRWSKQISQMKLFDLLIGNIDRNQGNLVYDADWHLFLIDHSRAFTTRKSLDNIAPLITVDRELWTRIEALTPESVEKALGAWLSKDEQEAIFERRAKMQEAVAKLVKDKGAARVFLE